MNILLVIIFEKELVCEDRLAYFFEYFKINKYMKEYLYYSLKVIESDRQKLMKWLQESMYDYLYEELEAI